MEKIAFCKTYCDSFNSVKFHFFNSVSFYNCFKLVIILLLQMCCCRYALSEQLINISCNADFLCVKVYEGDNVRLVLENKSHKPLSFKLILHGNNLQQFNQKQFKLEKPQTIKLFSLPSTSQLSGFEFRIHYGHDIQSHDNEYKYTLPFAPGSAYRVTQSHTNLSTHHPGNLYAIDWAMPEGDPVHAARNGTVVSTFASSNKGGIFTEATANHIWVQHSDGTIGKYLHLAHNGVFVEEGQIISAGELLGAAGNTGYSSGSHLHFSVSSLATKTLYQTFNVKFKTDSGIRSIESGNIYRHSPHISPVGGFDCGYALPCGPT